MDRKSEEFKWCSYPLLINPHISRYPGAYAGKIIENKNTQEYTKIQKKKEKLLAYVS